MKATMGSVMLATRERLGLTQVEVATMLRVMPKTLRNWENDRHLPTLENFMDWCSLFNAMPYSVLAPEMMARESLLHLHERLLRCLQANTSSGS